MGKYISYSEKDRFIWAYVDPVIELLHAVSVGPLPTFRGNLLPPYARVTLVKDGIPCVK